jgi:hypothetical protein
MSYFIEEEPKKFGRSKYPEKGQSHRFDSVVAKALRDSNNCGSDDVEKLLIKYQKSHRNSIKSHHSKY